MKNIKNYFKDKGTIRGKTLYLSIYYSIELVEQCKLLNIPIYGIDSAFIDELNTQPSLEHSVDFEGELPSNVYERAVQFLRSKEDLVKQYPNMLFEVVYEGY